jgi:LPPG:FO 2-phospho-L-lactate transferase
VITVLTGGTGGAKFAQGLAEIVPQTDLSFIVNTGDDMRWWGLHVSPDPDSIIYALAGLLSRDRGWGIHGDTFWCLEHMRCLGAETWFQLGDRDLATHLRRTQLLASGLTLTEATATIAAALGVRARVLPMSDSPVSTVLRTPGAELRFEEYFVRERHNVAVLSVTYLGASCAAPAPGVVEAILQAEAVLLAPSNPVTSVGPILAVPGVRQALCSTRAPVIAVSPIVAGAAVSGPASELMRAVKLNPSATGIAHAYRDFADALVIDHRDAAESASIEELGFRPVVTSALMASMTEKIALARTALEAARAVPTKIKRAALG